MKLDANKNVVKALHGSDNLTAEAIKDAYPGPLLDLGLVRDEKYWPLETFFEMPGAQLISELVSYVDRKHPEATKEELHALYVKVFGGKGASFVRACLYEVILLSNL